MAESPYRRPFQRPPPCAGHPDAPADGRCARCGRQACDDCLVFLGAGVVCSGCARGTRRRGALVRAVAALTLAVACVVPSYAVLGQKPAAWSPLEATVRIAIRLCEPGDLDLMLSSLVMNDHDLEVVAYGDRYAAACPLRAQTEGMITRARQRLADGLAP